MFASKLLFVSSAFVVFGFGCAMQTGEGEDAWDAKRHAVDPGMSHTADESRAEMERTPAPAPVPSPAKNATLPFLFVPDLTVYDDFRLTRRCSPSGCIMVRTEGVSISNVGTLTSDPFHVAVLEGSESYGFDVAPLAPGAINFYPLAGKFPVGSTAVIIVNPFNKAWESDYSNNVATFTTETPSLL